MKYQELKENTEMVDNTLLPIPELDVIYDERNDAATAFDFASSINNLAKALHSAYTSHNYQELKEYGINTAGKWKEFLNFANAVITDPEGYFNSFK